jgi:threonine synthase
MLPDQHRRGGRAITMWSLSHAAPWSAHDPTFLEVAPTPPHGAWNPTMRYVSTRGTAPALDFTGVLLAGLAEDGGLYVPETWPTFSAAVWRALRALPYPALAARVMAPFVGDAIPPPTLEAICRDAYAGFGHAAVAPLIQLDANLFVQELFHGPTLAFKDMAMQVLGRLFQHVLAERDQRITIVGATSGDTGSAAIEAFAGRDRAHIAILHPLGRTSEIQRQQMTTVLAPNVLNLAIQGTFDDCQDLLKGMFADTRFRRELNLSAVNSINWARIAAQIPYYAAAALALGAPDREVAFSVPSGNFGNMLAAWVARRMGLPIARLIVASNRNDILARFFDANDMSIRPVQPTLSPSMDIQISSNFERLLFELLNRDPRATVQAMQRFRQTGRMEIPDTAWNAAREIFRGFRLHDSGTETEIAHWFRASNYIADPHTAIGLAAARTLHDPATLVVAIATAYPAKFPDAVERAIGIRPALPARLLDLPTRAERFVTVVNDLPQVQAQLRAFARRDASAASTLP